MSGDSGIGKEVEAWYVGSHCAGSLGQSQEQCGQRGVPLLLARGSGGRHKAPLSPDLLLHRVDQDSALHNDLQILKEKEGADFILLNFSFKVSLPFQHLPPGLGLLLPLTILRQILAPPIIAFVSHRITFHLTHRLSGLCLQSFQEGEWLRAAPVTEGEKGA